MKSKLMAGTATAALSLALCSHAASAATLDDVMQRLDKLEKENSELKQEVNQLRGKKAAAPAPAPVAAAPAPAATPQDFKGNPVYHGAVAATPAPKPFLSVGGQPIITKAPGGWWVDNTTVTLYGHVDVSGDLFNPSVYDQGTKFGIASNSSYFGIRARHNLAPYGYDGYAFLAQFESQVDVASSPTEKAAFGTRDSYVGIEGPYGTIKAGKSDTPYKKATAAFDPFASTIADYNSIIGNTGGDNRAEFDWRMNHAVWYESPIWKGFQFSALVSPGQNYAPDNSDYSYGDLFNCNGAGARGSGSNFPNSSGALPGNIGGNGCTDGSFGNAYSAAATYKNGPLTLIAAGELHEGVNRHGDDGLEPAFIGTPLFAPIFLPNGQQVMTGVANEWAAKVGGGYQIKDGLGPLQLYAMYEWIRRDVPAAFEPFNERSKDDFYASATQRIGDHWQISAAYTRAGNTPGAPACLSLNNVNAPVACASPGPIIQLGQYQQNQFSEVANQYSAGVRYWFTNWASVYLVGTYLQQGMGAHYCLGASGHGYQVCSRDQFNDTIGGAALKAVSTGLTLDF
ncbi:MAG TPA: porin [Xanthobacteraceae bacterium]|nr:porin [Xanthobacteraceae bacterium]